MTFMLVILLEGLPSVPNVTDIVKYLAIKLLTTYALAEVSNLLANFLVNFSILLYQKEKNNTNSDDLMTIIFFFQRSYRYMGFYVAAVLKLALPHLLEKLFKVKG